MSKIAFIGGGSFGSALAVLLAKKGNEVTIYDRDEHVVNDINKNKRNSRYLKDLIIPEGVKAYSDMEEAINLAEYIVFAVPSHVIRLIAKSLKGKIPENIPIISIAKGIEEGTDKRLSNNPPK